MSRVRGQEKRIWYLGSAATRFAGADAQSLRRAVVTGRTSAQVNWSWSLTKMPKHVRFQSRAAVKFLSLCRQRKTTQRSG